MVATRAEIVAEARKHLYVRWKHQGRNTIHGIDCVGLATLVGENLALVARNTVPRNYPRRPDTTYVETFRKHMIEKRITDRKPGDVLLFATGSHPCHCGIMTEYYGQPGLIHAQALRKSVVEETLKNAEQLIGPPTHCFGYPGVE